MGCLLGTISSVAMAKHCVARYGLFFKYSITNDNTRHGLILCGLVSLVGWLAVFISSTGFFYLIYPGLTLLGWSVGFSSPLCSIYVSEIAGPGNKGVVTSLFNLNLNLGILFANILGVFVW